MSESGCEACCSISPPPRASPSGVVTQTAQTWMGNYDASDLCLLVNPAPARALPLCTRSDQPVAGMIVMPGPTPNLNGMSDCQWQNGSPGCIATGFSFGPELSGLSGTLPPPLPASEIGGLAAQYDGPQLRASWSVGGGTDDRLSLAASSSYTTPSLFGADPPKTYSNTLSCEVAPGMMAFAFPTTDAAWALEYGLPAVSLTLAKTTNQTFNLVGGPYDFLLLQMQPLGHREGCRQLLTAAVTGSGPMATSGLVKGWVASTEHAKTACAMVPRKDSTVILSRNQSGRSL